MADVSGWRKGQTGGATRRSCKLPLDNQTLTPSSRPYSGSTINACAMIFCCNIKGSPRPVSLQVCLTQGASKQASQDQLRTSNPFFDPSLLSPVIFRHA